MYRYLNVLLLAQRLEVLAEGAKNRTGLPRWDENKVESAVGEILTKIRTFEKVRENLDKVRGLPPEKYKAIVQYLKELHILHVPNPVSEGYIRVEVSYSYKTSFPGPVAVFKNSPDDIKIVVNLKRAKDITKYALIHELVHVFDPQSFFGKGKDHKKTKNLRKKHWSKTPQEKHAILVEILSEVKDVVMDWLADLDLEGKKAVYWLRYLIRNPDEVLKMIPRWRTYSSFLSKDEKFMRKVYKGIHDLLSNEVNEELTSS